MKIADIEIPYEKDRRGWYRFFEMLPALLSYGLMLLPVALSFINTTAAAYFLIGYILLWFVKAILMAGRVIQGYHRMQLARSLDWEQFLRDADNPEAALASKPHVVSKQQEIHYRNLETYVKQDQPRMQSKDLLHVAMVAAYNESMDVLEPTIKSVLDSVGDHDRQTVLVIAYEERGGLDIEKTCKKLVQKYGHMFRHVMAVKHPKDIPGELVGKGGNITYAARKLQRWLDEQRINYEHVLVTTLDADNRPDPYYFTALSYAYIIADDRRRKSFQPIPMYFTNVWDVPAPMRVIATGNSFWMVVTATRPHLLRNFSAHAQPMSALVDTDFWSVRTIVEDGHQFWRSYFRYDGKYEVLPLYVPIHQDAVLADGYWRTFKAQFVQLRRWSYGASDVAYVATRGFLMPNKINKWDLTFKFARLVEGHVSWATAALLLAVAGFIPLLFGTDIDTSVVAYQLPDLIATLQTIALSGILITMYVGIASLPPRPSRVPKSRSLGMVIQWVLLPATTLLFNTFAAINSQTRLLFRRYLGKFDVTEKAVKKE